MSETSTIEWTDATWNPVTGCSVQSPGCKNCYAMKLAGTRLKNHPTRSGLTQDGPAGPVWTGEVRFNSQWLEQPLQWSRARMIFVCAHGDLFHPGVPDEWIDQVFAVMALAPHHTFQVLTKQTQRAAEYFAHPVRDTLIGVQVSRIHMRRTGEPVSTWTGLPMPNVWIGTSAEDQRRLEERLPFLFRVPAEVRFLSMEPLLDFVSFEGLFANLGNPGDGTNALQALDWVIVGGESGPGARPMHPEWVRALRDQCQAVGTPFFFKQWGEWVPYEHSAQPPYLWGQNGSEIDAHALPDVESGDYDPATSEWHIDWIEHLIARRVGKKAAGRSLDGRTWDEMPQREVVTCPPR